MADTITLYLEDVMDADKPFGLEVLDEPSDMEQILAALVDLKRAHYEVINANTAAIYSAAAGAHGCVIALWAIVVLLGIGLFRLW